MSSTSSSKILTSDLDTQLKLLFLHKSTNSKHSKNQEESFISSSDSIEESLDSEIVKIRQITENLSEQTTIKLKQHKKVTEQFLAQTGNLNLKLADLQERKEILTPVKELNEKTEQLAGEFRRMSEQTGENTEESNSKREIVSMLLNAQQELNELQIKFKHQSESIANIGQYCEVEGMKEERCKVVGCNCNIF